MSTPRLPWPEPDFSYRPVYDEDEFGNVIQINAPEGARIMGGAGAYNTTGADSGRAGLSHALHAVVYNDPLPLIGRPWGGAGQNYAELPDDQRLATAQEHQRFVNSIIANIESGQTAYVAGSSAYSAMANAGGDTFNINYREIGQDLIDGIAEAETLGEAAIAVAEVGEGVLVDYAFHEARNYADPMLPGDTFEQKVANAFLLSIGKPPVFGDYRPDPDALFTRPIDVRVSNAVEMVDNAVSSAILATANATAPVANAVATPALSSAVDTAESAISRVNLAVAKATVPVTNAVGSAFSWISDHLPGHH